MPATRRARTSSGPAARGSQKTLSFSSSKTSAATSTKDKLEKSTPLSPDSKPSTLDIEPGHVSSEAAIAEQVLSVKAEVKRSPEEEKASKVTAAQIKRYWRDREAERRAPRVHQEDLSVEEKVLRLWDMSSQYGVSSPLLL
jgi:DNA polymerase delta subunit 4